MPRSVLPNSPLVEVVCEVRFPGDLSLLGTWGHVQADLRAEFPKMYVPGAEPGTSPLLQAINLASENDANLVLLAVNSFAFATRKYQNYTSFRQDFERTFGVFRKHSSTGSITRVGFRAQNLLPPVFPTTNPAPGQLHPCLKLALGGWSPPFEEQPSIVFTSREGDLRLRLALVGGTATISAKATNVRQDLRGVMLDLDCYMQGSLQAELVIKFMDDAHDLVERTFFSLITDEYHRFLEGRS